MLAVNYLNEKYKNDRNEEYYLTSGNRFPVNRFDC